MVLRALDRPQQRRDRLQPGGLDRVEVEPGGERVAEQPVELVGRLGRARSSSSRSTTSLRRLTSSNEPHEPYPAGIGLASSQPPLAKR